MNMWTRYILRSPEGDDGAGGGGGDKSLLGGNNGGDGGAGDGGEWKGLGIYGEGGNPNPEFVSSIKPEHAAFKSLVEKYNSEEALYQGINNLHAMAGKKGLTEPLPADATPEQIAERTTLMRGITGAPEEAAGYGFHEAPDALKDHYDTEFGGKVNDILHKHAVPPAAAAELKQAHDEWMQGQVDSFGEQTQQQDAQYRAEQMKQVQALAAQNLTTADEMIASARQGAQLLGLETAGGDSPFTNTAEGIAALARVANLVSEDKRLNLGSKNDEGKSYKQRASELSEKIEKAEEAGDHATVQRLLKQQAEFVRLSQV